MAMTSLQWPDYVILVSFLVISLGIGVYHSLTGGRQRTTQEFIMANRHLKLIPTTISLFVSFQSAIMVLGMTAEMYLYGVMYLAWLPAGFGLALLITERLFVPWIYPLKLVSVNDYYERRYDSKAVRILGAVLGIIGAIFYMGIAMYAPSAALESATGLPTTVSIPLMAVVSVIYTALGGMRAVIWTDVFQCVTMMGGMLAIMIKGMVVVGGFSRVLEICGEHGRLVATEWSLDPTVRHTCWGMLIGFSINWASVYGLTQTSVQRYSATESLKKARLTILLNLPGLAVVYFIAGATGLTVFAYYATIQCDPLVNKDVTSANQLLSLFVTTIFSDAQGFAGLFLATLYGGALSSVSSSLSGAAANCWEDILKLRLDWMPEMHKALVNRLLVVIFGVIATFFAFLAAMIPGPITQVGITLGGAAHGPLLGLFVLGGISRLAHWKGAICGGLYGFLMNFWLGSGALTVGTKHPALPPTSTDGCTAQNASWLFYNDSIANMLRDNDNDYTLVTGTSLLDNTTSGFYQPSSSPSFVALTGLARYYTTSYLWYTAYGMLNTLIVGTIVSFIFRDRVAEAKVDESLLISWRAVLSCGNDTGRTSASKTQHSDNQYTAVDCVNGQKLDIGISITNNNVTPGKLDKKDERLLCEHIFNVAAAADATDADNDDADDERIS